MNIYTLDLDIDNYKGLDYEIHSSFMIVSETAKEARKMANGDLPGFYVYQSNEQLCDLKTGERLNAGQKNNIWLKPKYTKIQKFGIASKGIKKGIYLASYNGR